MDIIDIVLSKKYTDESLKGITGTLAGKNCTIKSATKVDGVTTVVFAWTADDGTEKTTTIQVNDGVDGKDTSQEAVLFIEQKLDDAQRTQARENIGAADAARQNILMGSEIGNPIFVDDAFSTPLYGLTLYGKSTQGNTTGAQLFDVSEVLDETVLDIENPVVGNAVGYWTSGYIPVKTGNYIYSSKGTARGWVYDADKNGLRYINNAGGSQISIKEGEAFVRVSGKYPDDPQNFMFNEGDSIKPWEPYTGGAPSPSPSYPQEIESTGQDGEIGIEVGNNGYIQKGTYFLDVRQFPLKKGYTYYIKGEKIIGNDINCFVLNEYNKNFKNSAELFNYGYTTKKLTIPNSTGIVDEECRMPMRYDKDGYTFTVKAEGLYLYQAVNEPAKNTDEFYVGYTPNIVNEEYKKQTLIVPTPNGLPGIPVSSGGNYTDEKGLQWVCDEVDFKKGVYVQRIGKRTITSKDVFHKSGMSTDDVNYFSLGNFSLHIGTIGEKDVLMSNCFVAGINHGFSAWGKIFLSSAFDGKVYFSVEAQKYPDEETFKQWAVENGLMFLYQLTDIIETHLTAEELSAYKTLRTYSPTTTVANDAGAGSQLDYQRDVNISIKKLEDAIASMTTT